MKHFLILLCGVVLSAGAAQASEMRLSSTDIRDGQPLSNAQVFDGFGCIGDNISPQLSWSGVPAETKSLALTVYDPDAPTGSGWWHWLAFNIPADVESLASGASGTAMPDGVIESRTDFGATGFGGACPPEGDEPHRYIVTLYALDVEKLDLDENTPAAQVGYFLNAHDIATASMIATYGR